MPRFRRLSELPVRGKTILVRSDLNVPIESGAVTDPTRILRSAPTWEAILAAGGKVVILSHFDRPKGVRVPSMSLAPLRPAIEGALGGRAVTFVDDCIGPAAEAMVRGLPDGGIALLENVRFHSGEEDNDPAFAAALARLGDGYVGDAFSCAHRAHASVEALPRLLPNAAGLLMEAELDSLHRALERPERPVAAVVGGSKVSTKLDLLGNLVAKVDVLAIGGGMANTFLFADGHDVGASLCEHGLVDTVRSIQRRAADVGCTILLPSDVVVAERFAAHAPHRTVPASAVPPGTMILDIGRDSIAAMSAALERCRTLVWNGPMGAFELAPFDAGTVALAKAAAALTASGRLLSVAGGGDTVAALSQAGVVEQFSYVSTAGGAFLEWMEGKPLPGVLALDQAA